VVEFGLSLPDNLKVQSGQGKLFLKQWARRFLPKDYLFAPKHGFHVPVGEWLQGRLLLNLAEVLPHQPAIRNWFQPEAVKALIAHCRQSGPTSRMVWSLFQFAIWHKMFIDGKGERPPARQDPLQWLTED
jgi:asparagine synthase (glutamine-hydrolysing)